MSPAPLRRHRMKRTIAMATLVVAALFLTSAHAMDRVNRGTDDDVIDVEASETPSLRSRNLLITLAPAEEDDPVNTYVGTVAPVEEQTFFGLFPTKKVYLAAGMGGPALFLLYKLGMACWFCTAGRRKFAREDREHEEHALMEREEAERAAAAAAQAKEVEMTKDSRSFIKGGGAGTSNFWVEEELQAWRLDFQNLKLMKCLTATPDQRRNTGGNTTRPAAGEVWLATYYAMDEDNNQRMVALKWIPPKLANTEVQQEKLKEEIKRQAKLRHPNVAVFIGIAWSPETNLVAVTEYMARGDLRQWLHQTSSKDAGRWTPVKVKILLEITNALVYLHSFQPRLIHGNCNSRNVLLNERMEAKLSDFGAPKDYLSEREINAYKEVGSGRWISPEALIGREGAEHVSDAMDVYSLGILMVEMDTHQLPFADLMQADRSQLPEIDVLQLISNGALTPTLSPTCHPRIQHLVQACTAYLPQKRPSSRDIARTLQAVLQEMSGQGQAGAPAKRQ